MESRRNLLRCTSPSPILADHSLVLWNRQLTISVSRDHPAEEVYVTGTFDDWQKSEKLEKNGDVFSKNVTLKNADEKIYYKVRGRGEGRALFN